MGRYVRDEDRSLRTWFVALSLGFGLVTLWAVVDESWTRRPWKQWQAQYDDMRGGRVGVAIRQVVVPEIGVIDRCTTCHAGVDDPRNAGEDVPKALRTHSRRDVLLGKHPVLRYGCTSCHRGQGLALTAGTAHGDEDHYWGAPLLPAPFAQSSCLGCHPGDETLADAPLLGQGRRLFRELGCTGCHATDDQDEQPRRAPSLMHVDSKLERGWMLQWIRAPKQRRRGYRMPDFWPGAKDDPKMAERRDRESLAMAAYLAASSKPWPDADTAPARDESLVERGQQLFDTIGCRGCHVLGVEGKDTLSLRDETVQQEAAEDSWDAFGGDEEEPEEAVAPPAAASPIDFGPQLGDVGSRARYGFLYAWLRDPQRYWSGARMPDMRLTRSEARALASWAAAQGPEPAPVPAELTGTLDPALIASGRRLISDYGCAGCHQIPGFEDAGRRGPDLISYGRKEPHDLFFGDVPPPRASRTWERYTRLKLQTPRHFETDAIRQVMPRFPLSDDEVLALSVYMRGLVGRTVAPSYVHRPEGATLERSARRLVDEWGCKNCHTLDGRMGDIQRYYADPWLGPPPLDGVGGKLQPGFLFRFLVEPTPVRPWLAVRMPRFGLSDDDAGTLVRWFAAESGHSAPFRQLSIGPITPQRAASGAKFFTELKCVTCHMLKTGANVKTADLAPDLALARERLDPDWVRNFLVDPGKVLPGTRMPQFFSEGQSPAPELFGGDNKAQIDLLVDHLMHLGLQPAGRPDDDLGVDLPVDVSALEGP